MANADPFTALGRGNGFPFCIPTMDVTLGNDTDPSDPDYNGIVDYRALSLKDAMKVYWLMKESTVSGHASGSASAEMNGSYQRIIRRQVDPPTNPPTYVLETADQWSHNITLDPLNGQTTMVKETSPVYNDDPVPPQNKICGSFERVQRSYAAPNVFESGSDVQPQGESVRISASNSIGISAFDDQSDFETGRARVFLTTPPVSLRRFMEGDRFVGYGFAGYGSFGSGSCEVFTTAGVSAPFFVDNHEDESVFVYIGGFFSLGSLVFTEEFGQYAGTGQHKSVSFGGIDLLASASGSNNINISQSGGGVKFSFSDSDSGSPSYSYDDRDEYGAGRVFNGSGSVGCSGTFTVTMEKPLFWSL